MQDRQRKRERERGTMEIRKLKNDEVLFSLFFRRNVVWWLGAYFKGMTGMTIIIFFTFYLYS